MAVNLNKYRDSLLEAYKDVLNDKSATNWALFGYEGQSNDLKMVSKGAGGLEEMIEDLNSGKIMYAFCRVIDPKTSLPKCVLINWMKILNELWNQIEEQGEGAPLVRKGTCANHVRSVAGFLAGAHVTLNARTEEEVDPELIMASVSKATGSAYHFGERATDSVATNAPVGTVYKRVNPEKEINSQERDKFWEREEQEEKLRQAEEKKRKQEELLKLEQERKQRELAEAQQREERIRERSRSITQIREAELRAAQACNKTEAFNAELEDREREEMERRGRSEELRRQRSQEAQALISQRTINARALFEKNTAAGQMLKASTPRRASAAAVLPTWPPNAGSANKVNGTEASNGLEKNIVQQKIVEQQPPMQTTPTPDTLANVAPQQNGIKQPSPMPDVTEVHKNKQQAQTTNDRSLDFVPEETQEAINWEPTSGLDDAVYQSEVMLQARALYDYQAADSNELTFDPGDVITHIEQIDEGWWQGLGPDGTFGLFPANYVELIQ